MSKVLIENHEIVIPGDLLAEGNFKYGEGVIKRGNQFYSTTVGLFQDKGEFIQVKALKGDLVI
ncbi:MAG: hypothetical protein ACTSRO_02795 [Candidatus Heimdallarchaeaceae archaeon]